MVEVVLIAVVVLALAAVYSVGGLWLAVPAAAAISFGFHRATVRLRARNDEAGR